MKKYFIYITVLVLLILSGCNRPSANASKSIKVADLEPTQDSGIFVCQIKINNRPASEFNLYLAEVIIDNAGNEIMTRFDRTSPLRSSPDEDGNFVIYDIPPGRYSLIADYVSHAIPLENQDDATTILITINENEVHDLGLLEFPFLQ